MAIDRAKESGRSLLFVDGHYGAPYPYMTGDQICKANSRAVVMSFMRAMELTHLECRILNESDLQIAMTISGVSLNLSSTLIDLWSEMTATKDFIEMPYHDLKSFVDNTINEGLCDDTGHAFFQFVRYWISGGYKAGVFTPGIFPVPVLSSLRHMAMHVLSGNMSLADAVYHDISRLWIPFISSTSIRNSMPKPSECSMDTLEKLVHIVSLVSGSEVETHACNIIPFRPV